jgi:hypothetical protein
VASDRPVSLGDDGIRRGLGADRLDELPALINSGGAAVGETVDDPALDV